MYLCILNQVGAIVLHRNMPADPDSFLKAIAPFRKDIVIAVECIFTWYRARLEKKHGKGKAQYCSLSWPQCTVHCSPSPNTLH